MFNIFQELGLPVMGIEIVADNARSHAPLPDDSSSLWSSQIELSHSSHSGRREYCRWDSDGSSSSHQSPTTVAFHFRTRAARLQRKKPCEQPAVLQDQHQPSRLRSTARQNRYPKKLNGRTDDKAFDSDNDIDHNSEEEQKPNCRWFGGSPDPFEQSPDQMRRTRKHLKRRGLPPRLPTRPQLTRADSEPLRVRRVRTWPPSSSVLSAPALPSSLDDSTNDLDLI